MPTDTAAASKPGVWSEYRLLLARGWGLVRAGGARLAALILITHLVVLGVALPVLGWLFREALRANGMSGLDLGQLRAGGGIPLTIALILVIVALAFWLISLQFAAFVTLLHRPGISGRELLGEFGRVTRKLLRPSSFPLVLYLFLLLPLTGFGFTSAFTRGIAIPSFISGELLKSASSGVALVALLLLLALLNIRLALTVPVFVLTSGGRSARASWRLTRGLRAAVPLVLAIATAMVLGAIAAVAVIAAAIIPTALTDLLAPDASPFVAAYSLGAAQVVGLLLSGSVTAFIAAVLIVRVRRGEDRLPAGVELLPGEGSALDAAAARHPRPRGSRRPAAIVTAAAVVVALGFGTAGIGTLQRLSDAPETLVLAHRGFSDGGVENTLSGLEAAASAGADLVEMDVMQTADGGFVAMHDATLERLAGRPDAVKNLTVAELTAVTVRDLKGHEDRIPAFADYVSRAGELGMPLLIEIKLGGADTPDHVERLIAELERLDALESNIYHSLDAASVARLKQLRPDLTVGYTMAFAGAGVPDTPADFIVVEEWTATDRMQDATWNAGLGFLVWTVNDDAGMHEHLRRNSDGIITDRPDRALGIREEMQQETGLSGVLIDALTRFVTVV
jgi:glycerophosphoryl diester phosphodiesterase